MYKGSSSRVVPIIIVLIIVAIAVAALVSVGRAVFGGGTSTPVQTDTGREALLNTSVDHSVRMTVRGPIVADEKFHSYQIKVDANSRTLTTYTGYLDQAIATQQLGNNVKAYDEFVHALDNANMMKGTALTGDKDETRGVCATGRLYEFEVLSGSSVVKRLWTTTCRGSAGSFTASVSQVQNLFVTQMPDGNALLSKIDL
jgi:hypothetical protein